MSGVKDSADGDRATIPMERVFDVIAKVRRTLSEVNEVRPDSIGNAAIANVLKLVADHWDDPIPYGKLDNELGRKVVDDNRGDVLKRLAEDTKGLSTDQIRAVAASPVLVANIKSQPSGIRGHS